MRGRLWGWIVLLMVFGCGGPPRVSVQDEGPPPPDLTTRPYGLTAVFIEHLRADRYPEAYELLSQSLKNEITIVQFKDALGTWRKANPSAAEEYVVRREQVSGDQAQTQFGPPDGRPAGPGAMWTLRMVKEREKWRISRISGPAFSR